MSGVVDDGSSIFLEEVRVRMEVLNSILGMTLHNIIPPSHPTS